MRRGAARARAAVQEDRRLAARVAAELPIDPVAITDVEMAVLVGLDRGIELGSGRGRGVEMRGFVHVYVLP